LQKPLADPQWDDPGWLLLPEVPQTAAGGNSRDEVNGGEPFFNHVYLIARPMPLIGPIQAKHVCNAFPLN
jgi:hypothetical protein